MLARILLDLNVVVTSNNFPILAREEAKKYLYKKGVDMASLSFCIGYNQRESYVNAKSKPKSLSRMAGGTMTMVNSFPERMNLSFSGCGFLCIYHAGVAAAIKEYAPQLTQNKISGASAGAIVAAGLMTNICISQATSTILKVVTQARSRALGPLHPAFNLLSVTREQVELTLPPDAYKT
ncbi:hypothetical protein TELCIR_14794, partial [Teladorsagia circumcincta]